MFFDLTKNLIKQRPLIMGCEWRKLLLLSSSGLFPPLWGLFPILRWPFSAQQQQKRTFANKTLRLRDETSSWHKYNGCCQGSDLMRNERKRGDNSRRVQDKQRMIYSCISKICNSKPKSFNSALVDTKLIIYRQTGKSWRQSFCCFLSSGWECRWCH